MAAGEPRVSVVVPTRDRLALLRRALAGVDAQSFRDLELIVVDDGSLDGTSEWVHAERPDVRLETLAHPAGAAAARNHGLDLARGELIAFLDDDDLWRPTCLEEHVAHLDADPELLLSHCAHIDTDPAGNGTVPNNHSLIPHASQFVHMLAEAYIYTMSVVVCRREAFERFGRLDEHLVVNHDVDWYLRLLAGGGAMQVLSMHLVERSVPGGLVTDHRRWFAEERDVITRALAARPEDADEEPMIRAYRALFFARLALGKGDVRFGLARLVEAIRRSPRWTARLIGLALARRIRGERPAAPDAGAALAEATP